MKRIVINPVTRISGFLGIDTVLEDHVVKDARTEGLLFRGFEKMLFGRSPFDAVYFTERICGICSTAHGMASTLALEDALSVTVSQQGRYLRDIIHGSEFLQNHIRHFYQYTVPDYVRLPAGNTLFETNHEDFRLPREKNDRIAAHYFDSLPMSADAHEMLAILGGKAPHNHGIFIGGSTAQATEEKIAGLRTLLQGIKTFIVEKMIPDAYTIAAYYPEYYELGRGYGNLLSFGCFDRYAELGTLYVDPLVTVGDQIVPLYPDEITENIYTSWYTAKEDTYTPFELLAEPDMKKGGAYSWVKAPRYQGLPYEVGPLARMWLSGAYRNGISAMDRTLARALEAKKIADIIEILLDQLLLNVMTQEVYDLPQEAQGMGLIDTTRGALGHWLKIEKGVISFYQIITPSAWNLSTRCQNGMPGPGEKALIGTAIDDEENPVELGRIIRTFDPCVSCATHVYRSGKPVKTLVVMP